MNAPQSRDHLSGGEIARAISTVSTLAAEVIKHSDHLEPVYVTVRRPRSTVSGYVFSTDPDNPRLIVEQGKGVRIAVRKEFPFWHRNSYILLPASDYVSTWVAEVGFISGDNARKAIKKVLFQMKQLLPDGHPMKRTHIEDSPVRGYAGSSLER